MPTREILEPPADFAIDRETLAFIVLKARAFDALIASDDPTDGSNDADDRFVDALEDEADNPAQRELRSAIVSLNSDGRAQLVALAWLGRGDYEASDWREAVAAARERAEGSTARYLMGIPLLGDYIEEGADKLGISLAADEVLGVADPDIDTRGG
ncbi:MAG TPA: DUF3775 domain-containing protein [Vitreimonas sp.]|uniref:DUF3775 domain-containing protein n=1 Tax=Vitreimonas sp. TaxID=3069702 RepID=UPI002D41B3FB|nr:DUF3775 domain-containing protein [Vitreimonas sp.]HYD87486.1 DUF3775 domain-containing protein [Vitreimonas sp.]